MAPCNIAGATTLTLGIKLYCNGGRKAMCGGAEGAGVFKSVNMVWCLTLTETRRLIRDGGVVLS